MATLVSVNVGLPKDVAWNGRTVYTGVWKQPVRGPRMVRRLNVDGDGQGDLGGHGGEHRAVLVYQLDSYRYWSDELHRDDLQPGISARTSRSRVCRTTRCASGTDTASGMPSSKSPNRGSPATGSACDWRAADGHRRLHPRTPGTAGAGQHPAVLRATSRTYRRRPLTATSR